MAHSRHGIPVHGIALLAQPPLDALREGLREQLALRPLPITRIILEHLVRLHQQFTLVPPEHEGLVDHRHTGARLDEVIEQLDVLGEQPDAAVARSQADTGGLVGAVDEIARPLQVERTVTERVVRARWHHDRQHLAIGLVLRTHPRPRTPGGIFLHPHHAGAALRRRPTDAADPDREGVDGQPFPRLALREIEQAHRCQIDDDALTRRVREDMPRRQYDLATCAR